MAQVICPDCGTANNPGIEFCVSCGGFLAWEGDAPPAEPAPPVGPQAPQQGQHPGAPGAPAPQPPAQAAPEQQYRYRSAAPPVPAGPPPANPPVGPPAGYQQGGFEPPPQRFAPPAGDPGGFSYTIRAPAGRAAPQGGPGWPPGPGMLEDEGQVATAPPGSCPQCGRVNTPDRRFCGKCGYQLFTPDPRTPPPKVSPQRKRPWWQRWIPERWLPEKELVSGEAKRAFRRQLPVGIRLRRGFGIAGVLALIIGGLFVMGTNPVRWVKDRIADSKGSLAVIAGVAATADPVDSPLPTSPASNLVNGDLGAWGIQWAPTGAAPVCVPPGAEGSPASAILTLPGLTEVRALDLTAGLEETNPLRAVQFRPKTVQLAFSDGTCQTVQLEDAPGTQREDITPVTTGQIRVTVTDAYAPASEGMPIVSMAEIAVLARP